MYFAPFWAIEYIIWIPPFGWTPGLNYYTVGTLRYAMHLVFPSVLPSFHLSVCLSVCLSLCLSGALYMITKPLESPKLTIMF